MKTVLWSFRIWLGALAAVVLAFCVAGPAEAACTPTTGNATGGALGNYNPFTGSLTGTASYQITFAAGSSCPLFFSLGRATSTTTTMSLASPVSTLGYTVSVSGTNAVSIFSTTPTAGQYVTLPNVTGAQTVTVNVTYTIPANEVGAAGAYADTVYPEFLTALSPLAGWYLTTTVTATVLSVCNLPAPTAATLDFSAAVSTGTASAGTVMTDSIVNAQCTAPTRLELSGNSLQPTPVGTAPSGFDNFINWTATATLGSATATITTTGLTATAPVLSTNKNTTTAGAIAGTISFTAMHLIAGQPILAGTYKSSLTIQIDPSL